MGDTAEFAIDVTSLLTRAMRNVIVTVESAPLTIQAATTASGVCPISGTTATCTFNTIAAGTSARINVQAATPSTAGSFEFYATLTAANDADPSNNSAHASIRIDPRRDIGIERDATPITSIVNEWTTVPVVIRSLGVEAVDDVLIGVTLMGRGSQMQTVTVDAGACTGTAVYYTCSLGTMQPGTSRTITAVVRGTSAESLELRTGLLISDQQGNNDDATRAIYVGYAQDVTVLSTAHAQGFEEGEISSSATVRSVGITATHNIVTTFEIPSPSRVVSASMEGATCTLVSEHHAMCALPSLEPNESVQMIVRTISDSPGVHTGVFTVTAPEDGDPTNNSRAVQLTVIPFLDIGLDEIDPVPTLIAGHSYEIPLRVFTGRTPVTNAGLNLLDLNSGVIELESLNSTVGTCSAGTSAWCTFGDLPPYANVLLVARVRAVRQGRTTLQLRTEPMLDSRTENSTREVEFSVLNLSDATISVANTSVSATAGTNFGFPTITISGTNDMPEVTVEISVPETISVVSASTGGGTCSGDRPIVCTLSMMSNRRTAWIDVTLNARRSAATRPTCSSACRMTHPTRTTIKPSSYPFHRRPLQGLRPSTAAVAVPAAEVAAARPTNLCSWFSYSCSRSAAWLSRGGLVGPGRICQTADCRPCAPFAQRWRISAGACM